MERLEQKDLTWLTSKLLSCLPYIKCNESFQTCHNFYQLTFKYVLYFDSYVSGKVKTPTCAIAFYWKLNIFRCCCGLLTMAIFKRETCEEKLLLYFQRRTVLFWYVSGCLLCALIESVLSPCRVWSKWCRSMLYKYNLWGIHILLKKRKKEKVRKMEKALLFFKTMPEACVISNANQFKVIVHPINYTTGQSLE